MLAVRAASAGRLDFSMADDKDPKWVLREALVLNAIEEELYVDYLKVSHNQDSAAASAVLPGKKGTVLYTFHTERAVKTQTALWNTLFPYNKQEDTTEIDKSEEDKLAARYRELFSKD